MRDDDAAGLGRHNVGRIEADAEGRNDLQIFQPVDQVGVRSLAATGQNAANARADLLQQLVRVAWIDEVVEGVLLLQPFNQKRGQGRDLQ